MVLFLGVGEAALGLGILVRVARGGHGILMGWAHMLSEAAGLMIQIYPEGWAREASGVYDRLETGLGGFDSHALICRSYL